VYFSGLFVTTRHIRNAKVLLTVRNTNSWYKSVSTTIYTVAAKGQQTFAFAKGQQTFALTPLEVNTIVGSSKG
jgi:hypothetical protein